MRFSTVLPFLVAAGVAQAQFGGNNGGNNGGNKNNNNGGNNGGGGNLALNPKNVQDASNSDGLAGGEQGQAASAKDGANFINFCTGKTLTNGKQVKQGSCNGIPMGDIPSTSNMVSAIMINPKNGDNVQANQAINFQVQIANLEAGSFTNPDNTYYAAPQALKNGKVVGHTHFTVQDLGNNINPTQPLDAQKFAFFKGVNDNGNGNGLLSANLAQGLPNGNYRVCTLTSASNHQFVTMPVAQRGAQDDCVRFTVGGNGGGGGNNNNNPNNNGGTNGQAGGKGGQAGGQGGQPGGQGGGRRAGGRFGRFGRKRFTARDFIA